MLDNPFETEEDAPGFETSDYYVGNARCDHPLTEKDIEALLGTQVPSPHCCLHCCLHSALLPHLLLPPLHSASTALLPELGGQCS